MSDLFVYTADADALAVVRAVLSRPQAIRTRGIDFEVDRHTGRDPGMVKDGPELVRFRKTAFEKALLVWDHQGSGWDAKDPEEARAAIRNRLDQCIWRDRSEALVIVPELEEWLWHSPASIAGSLGITVQALDQWASEFAEAQKTDLATCKKQTPKELFEFVLYRRRRRKPLPGDFALTADRASLRDWQHSPTFTTFVAVLRTWFPR
jgi:hypothetical protein